MLNSRKHWRVLLAVLAVFALIVAACGGDDDDSSSCHERRRFEHHRGQQRRLLQPQGHPERLRRDVPAGRSTRRRSPASPKKRPNLTVNYGGGGSGKGKQDLADGVVDWAGTDSLVKPEDMAKYDAGGGIFYFPTVAAPITVSFNLSGVDKLQLDADTLAGIFSRKITKWNDAAIAATNDGVDLPDTDIVVAHRADASGTTNNFTKYLMTAAPTTWTLGNGDTVNWPADTQAGNGNPGVAQIVSQTERCDRLRRPRRRDGGEARHRQDQELVRRASSHRRSTVPRRRSTARRSNPDLTYNPLNASGAKAYPITSPTYIIVYKTTKNSAQTGNIQGWLNYVLGPAQGMAKDAGFASLPEQPQGQGSRPDRPDQVSNCPVWRIPPLRRRTAPAGSVTHGNAGDVWADRIFRGLALVAGLAVLAILALIAYLDHASGVARVQGRGLLVRHVQRVDSERGQVRRAGLHLRHAVHRAHRDRDRGAGQPRHRAVHHRDGVPAAADGRRST